MKNSFFINMYKTFCLSVFLIMKDKKKIENTELSLRFSEWGKTYIKFILKQVGKELQEIKKTVGCMAGLMNYDTCMDHVRVAYAYQKIMFIEITINIRIHFIIENLTCFIYTYTEA